MTKTMTRDTAPSGAMVTSGLRNLATAAAGRIPFPQLTRTNYAVWKMMMKYLLRANGGGGCG